MAKPLAGKGVEFGERALRERVNNLESNNNK